MAKRQVEDMSGFCRHGGYEGAHGMCGWGQGIETPSAVVVCVCSCHGGGAEADARSRVLVPKTPRTSTNGAAQRVLVPKK